MRFLKGGQGTSSKNGGSSTFLLWIWWWFPQKMCVGMTPSIWQKWPHDPMFRSLQTSAPGKVLPQMGPVRSRRSRLEEAGCYFFEGYTPSPFIIGDTSSNGWFSIVMFVFFGGIYFLNGHGNCQLAPLQDSSFVTISAQHDGNRTHESRKAKNPEHHLYVSVLISQRNCLLENIWLYRCRIPMNSRV